MRVLIGCETSGKTRRAFTARGHEAWSCDLLPADDNSPMHFQMDIRHILRVLRGYFDLFIVHPTCTYLSSSGLHWNTRGRIEADGRPRAAHTEDAVAFAIEMMQADIPRIAMENPVGCLSTRYREPDQYIQPHEFGHDASKKTCLWLKGLQPLAKDPALYVEPRIVNGKKRWANQTDSGQNVLGPSDDRWKLRSETYQGWSDAMAAQWGVVQ